MRLEFRDSAAHYMEKTLQDAAEIRHSTKERNNEIWDLFEEAVAYGYKRIIPDSDITELLEDLIKHFNETFEVEGRPGILARLKYTHIVMPSRIGSSYSATTGMLDCRPGGPAVQKWIREYGMKSLIAGLEYIIAAEKSARNVATRLKNDMEEAERTTGNE